jgi:dihydrolipoamide dehydrogenase
VTEHCQIAIIGAGPGGYVAAIRAARRGASVTLIEKDSVGGTCLNRGCIPSKALISAAKRYHILQTVSRWGFSTGNVTFDWQTVVRRKDAVVAQLRRGIEILLKKNRVNLVRGAARLLNARKIGVEIPDKTEVIQADKIILAAGAETSSIPSFPIDHNRIVTSDDALSWESLPGSLIIVGGGVIGCELAMLFAAFGVKITLIEALPSILALTTLDDVIISRLESLMKKAGIALMTNATLKNISHDSVKNGVLAVLDKGKSVSADKALISIGRKPMTGGLGLEEAGIVLSSQGRGVATDEKMRTNIPGTYAIGDMTGLWQLAHVASYQGIIAAEDATGHEHPPLREDIVPSCIFTDPPATTIGLSEKEAEKRGIEAAAGEFPYRALGKAIASDEAEGLIRVIVEKKTGRIIGAHLLGEGAPEMIHEFTLAIRHNLKADDLMDVIHAHPTYSEGVAEACESIYNLSIHI